MSMPMRETAPGEWTAEDAFETAKASVGDTLGAIKRGTLLLWGRTSRRIRAAGGIIIFIIITLSLWRPSTQDLTVPKVYLDYGHRPSPYNETKVALLIENRPSPILAPLMLHFMSVVPPEWKFRFMGSEESVAYINKSASIRHQVGIGKLDLTYIPSNMTTSSQEEISRFLTTLWLYETVLQPAEYLLVFQTDSMLCANSRQSINEWLEYDWVGAPWNPHGSWGGNGGLSLRKVKPIIDILRNQVREPDTIPEDVWLAERLAGRPDARMANGTASLTFSGEMHGGEAEHVKPAGKLLPGDRLKKPAGGGIDSDATYAESVDTDLWREGFYEPMGYHTGGSGNTLHGGIWGTPGLRKHIWDYCPEIKIWLTMDAAQYVPGDCNSNWRRDAGAEEYGAMEKRDVGMGSPSYLQERGWDINNVDENGYPYLPANLAPW